MKKILIGMLTLASLSTFAAAIKQVTLSVDLSNSDLQVVKNSQMIAEFPISFRPISFKLRAQCTFTPPIGEFQVSKKMDSYIYSGALYKNVLFYNNNRFTIRERFTGSNPDRYIGERFHGLPICGSIFLKRQDAQDLFKLLEGYKNENIIIEINE